MSAVEVQVGFKQRKPDGSATAAGSAAATAATSASGGTAVLIRFLGTGVDGSRSRRWSVSEAEGLAPLARVRLVRPRWLACPAIVLLGCIPIHKAYEHACRTHNIKNRSIDLRRCLEATVGEGVRSTLRLRRSIRTVAPRAWRPSSYESGQLFCAFDLVWTSQRGLSWAARPSRSEKAKPHPRERVRLRVTVPR